MLVGVLIAVAIGCSNGASEPPLSELRSRPFPFQLENDAPRLAETQVTAVWTAFLSGARLTSPQVQEGRDVRSMTDYCSNMTGRVVRDPAVSGATFRWQVVKPLVSAWNDAELVVVMDDPNVPVKLGYVHGARISFRLNGVDFAKTGVYDMPRPCPLGG